MKLSIILNDELIKKVNEYAKRHYITRTSAITVLLVKALEGEEKNVE